MNSRLIAICLFLLTLNTFSQYPKATWSEVITPNPILETTYLGAHGNSVFYQQANDGYTSPNFNLVHVDLISKKLNLTLLDDATYLRNDSVAHPIGFLQQDDKIYGLSKGFIFKEKIMYAVHEITLSDQGAKRANEVSRKQFYEFAWDSNVNMGSHKVIKSDDKTKTLIFIHHPIDNKSATSTFGICLFDGIELIEAKTIEMNIPSSRLNLFDTWVDNAGNVYIRANYKPEKERLIEHYFIKKGTNDIVKIDLNLGENVHITDFRVEYSPKYGPMICGAYVDFNRMHEKIQLKSHVNGLFIVKTQNEVFQPVNKIEITDEILVKYHKIDAISDMYTAIYFGNLIDFQFSENGDIICALENSYTKDKNVTPPSPPGDLTNQPKIYEYTHTFKDVLILGIDQEQSTIKWSHVLRKNQEMVTRNPAKDHLSISLFCLKNKIVILYNNIALHDQLTWIDEKGNTVQKASKNQYYPVFMLQMDLQGNVLSQNPSTGDYVPNLFSGNDNSFYLSTTLNGQLGENSQALMIRDWRANFSVGKVEF